MLPRHAHVALGCLLGLAMTAAGCGDASPTPEPDLDGDGFSASADCDDDDATVNPDATEVVYNGTDDDCDALTLDDDLDEDGFLAAADCDDDDDAIHPDATDTGWDGEDSNCDERDLGASLASPVRDVRADDALDGRTVVRLATNDSHALVVGVSETGLGATLSAGSTGTSVDVVISTPGDLVPHRVTAFGRGDGFGVLYTLEDYGANSWCHVYAHTVSNAGVVGPAVQITAVVPAAGMTPAINSAALCDRDPLGVQGESDWVFFMQPQGVVAGNSGNNPQLVRRTLNLAAGGGSLSVPSVFGVNQGGAGGQLLDIVHNGEIAALAYTFTSSIETKLTLWNETGMLNNAANAQVYGGEGVVFAAPANGQPPVGVRLVGTAFDDVNDTSSFTFSRLEGAAGQRALQRVEVVVTAANRGTPGVTYTSSIGTVATVTDMLAALGNAGAVGFGDSRYTWCAADTLVGAVYGTSDAGLPIDASFSAVAPVRLVDSRQTADRVVHLVSTAGVHRLIIENP